ncbi:MAG TPA: quinolinate synthase NadA [Candidatus Omnitrophota bacterium]|nr:quinolinate synthase NadA [Candidatus Omnitrophota bacterium]
MSNEKLLRQIVVLKKKRRALILAHNYQRPEIQDIADFTGDSLELSIVASRAENPVIVFCGVKFMAETAAVLCPGKKVLLPVKDAGCALADMATAEALRKLKKKHPRAQTVAYVNTSAEVKAESDICCTSANAVKIVASLDPKRPVIFVSDRNLGAYAARKLRRKLILWDGFCPTHTLLVPADVRRAVKKHPGAKVMAHPECRFDVLESADYVGGTAGMLKYVKGDSGGRSYLVATEAGMIHRLKKENPGKNFYPVSDDLICPMMKLITLEDVRNALSGFQFRVTVNPSVRKKARRAITKMLSVR